VVVVAAVPAALGRTRSGAVAVSIPVVGGAVLQPANRNRFGFYGILP